MWRWRVCEIGCVLVPAPGGFLRCTAWITLGFGLECIPLQVWKCKMWAVWRPPDPQHTPPFQLPAPKRAHTETHYTLEAVVSAASAARTHAHHTAVPHITQLCHTWMQVPQGLLSPVTAALALPLETPCCQMPALWQRLAYPCSHAAGWQR